ncbi:MAG TPA: DUF6064 family protein [Acidiferrobacterales bacterium]|nr:DUF6064 family protein [Acidiferrobacterales bacterium]
MALPFTSEQFFGVFATYNDAVWPAQLFLLALAVLALAFVAFPRTWSGWAVSAILAFLWAWLALAYHLAFFASVNPLAYVFAAVSAAGALVFVWQGVVKRKLHFQFARSARVAVGAALVVFALFIYPAWSIYSGHGYPAMPTFGLPCPTTLFTIGLLAFLVSPYPRSSLVVPVLWCLVGAQAAFLLGVWQDLGLLVAAAVGAVLIARSWVPAARVPP